jgi:NTE family protein
MSRALVLGGGGPVGIGWQAGLLAGLADAGVTLREADLVIGTSAGSVVGAQLTSDRPLADVVAPIGEAPPWASSELGAGSPDLAELLANRTVTSVSEDQFVARFAFLSGVPWPETFRCTAFDLEAMQPAVWDRASGVELHRAVASSCSVPGISPAVTIAGANYIDGGARDMLNADLAIGHDVVVVVSCIPLDPPEGMVPDLLAGLLPAVRQRIEDLRASGSAVEVVEPSDEVRELSGWGRYLMDFARTAAAYDAGVRQGTTEAAGLGPFWSA